MKHNQGFTLIELMITIAVAAILIAMAVPSFVDTLERNRVGSAANDLMAQINMLRSEALKRGKEVVLCQPANTTDMKCKTVQNANATPTKSKWDNGRISFYKQSAVSDITANQGEDKLLAIDDSNAYQGITIEYSHGDVLQFNHYGAVAHIHTSSGIPTFYVCPKQPANPTSETDKARKAAKIRVIELIGSGRPIMTPYTYRSTEPLPCNQ